MDIRRVVRRAAYAALVGLAAFAAAGCSDDAGPIVVGSTDFTEQEIVAEMYASVLENAGFEVERRFGLGPREIVLPALQQGDIDIYPEYVGTALEALTGGQGAATADTAETTGGLREAFAEHDVEVLEPAPAQDRNGLVVTAEAAGERGLQVVSDLEPIAGELVFGGPPECPQRPLCLQGYEEVYGLSFRDFRALDASGPLTWSALENGDIDVALMFTTQGIIFDRGWVLLEEDRDLQPAENIVPVIRDDAVTAEVRDVLNELSRRLTTEAITELNKRVDVDGEDPATVAEEWLRSEGLLTDES